MNYAESIHHQKQPVGWQLLLAAFLFLLVQLNLAVHDTEHLTGEHEGYSCELCLTGSLDLDTPSAKAVLPGKPANEGLFFTTTQPLTPRQLSAFQSRAPPTPK